MKQGCRPRDILLTTTLLASGFALNVSSEATQVTSANSVLSWNAIAMTAIATSQITTGGARHSRAGAMVQVAVHDALNAIEHRYEPYAIAADAPGASADAAVASAAYHVLVGMFPYEATTLDPLYANALAAIPDGQAKTDGIAVGQTVAQGILDLRANDNSAPNTSYTFGPPDPGVYQATPPAYLPPVEPHWGEVTVFGLDSADQFRPDGPDSVSSAEYATDFNEVKSVGSLYSTTRTPEQSEIGRFWIELSPSTWNRIARVVSAAHPEKDAWEIGRLLAMENVALADAFIAGFEAKYFYNFWRPVTAIRAADTDGNPETEADPNWLPWGIPSTPPTPRLRFNA